MINGVAHGKPLGLPTDDEMRAFLRRKYSNVDWGESIPIKPEDRGWIILDMSRDRWDKADAARERTTEGMVRFVCVFAVVLLSVVCAFLIYAFVLHFGGVLQPSRTVPHKPVVCSVCKETIQERDRNQE